MEGPKTHDMAPSLGLLVGLLIKGGWLLMLETVPRLLPSATPRLFHQQRRAFSLLVSAPNGGTGIGPVMSCMEPRLWLMLTKCDPQRHVVRPKATHGT